MPGSPNQAVKELYEFGPFRVDPEKETLLRAGEPVPLTPKTFQILLVLVRSNQKVVAKDDLMKLVWPDTFVEEANLSRNIFLLRKALGESPQDRYILTVPGRGYRLAENVHPVPGHELNIIAASHSKMEVQVKETKGWPWTVVAVLAAIAIGAGVWGGLHLSPAREIRVQQLTTNSAENPIWHAVISPDGKYAAYGDLAGIQVRLIATGEAHLLPRPQTLSSGDAWFPAAWFPDGTRILATSITSTASTAWTVSVIGGSATILRDNALVQSVSPDGALIAFITSNHMKSAENAINRRLLWNSEIWIMGADGENARIVAPGDNLTYFGSVRWSPDGKHIGYQRFRLANGSSVDYTIEIRDLKGGPPAVIYSTQHYRGMSVDHNFPEDFCWLADGRIVYAVREPSPNIRDSNLWEVAVDANRGKLRSQPRKITNLAGFHMEALSSTADGRRLLFESSTDQSYVYVGRLAADGKLENPRRLTPDERYNTPYAWTADSKSVIFRSDRTGSFSIYKQALDQDVPELIPTGSGNPLLDRVSQDGTWLIYAVLPNADSTGEYRLMRTPLAGGPPQVIFDRTRIGNFDCPLHRSAFACVMLESSSDGKEGVFSSFFR
jgi:DNA-binding winged helix-turn-helix (wHTH) protein/Tol biopolymer transport system component